MVKKRRRIITDFPGIDLREKNRDGSKQEGYIAYLAVAYKLRTQIIYHGRVSLKTLVKMYCISLLIHKKFCRPPVPFQVNIFSDNCSLNEKLYFALYHLYRILLLTPNDAHLNPYKTCKPKISLPKIYYYE